MNDLGFWKIVIVAAGIGLMLLLNIKGKINGLIALLLASLFVGLLEGLGLADLVGSIQTGFGSTLGSLALVVVFGVVLGKLMVDCSASHQIASTLLRKFGRRYVDAYRADIGLVLIYGVLVAVPSVICAGLILPRFLGNLERPVPTLFKPNDLVPESALPRQ